MFTIHFTNFGYSHQDSFNTLEAAVAKAKQCGFEATILQGERLIGSWTIFQGYRSLV